MSKEKENIYPRILVLSNNPFSETSNNGKTLASFFENYPSEKIAQLYFSNENPTDSRFSNYFRITDEDNLKFILNKKSVGSKIKVNKNIEHTKEINRKNEISQKIKVNNVTRIIREIVWYKKSWRTKKLNDWLDKFSPEVIFFCAGDSAFAYDIANYINENYETKLVVYITDDYILPRKKASVFWWVRRNYVLKKMKITVNKCDLFFTISKEMQEVYNKLFKVKSLIAINMTESLKDFSLIKNDDNKITLVYAGGLHFNRYITLKKLANSIRRYNMEEKSGKKAFLEVYSAQEISDSIKSQLNIDGASKFKGKLFPEQVKKVLNLCDIPVHVESFDSESIESTRLSISTKIPEYLSVGKPILAIGPEQVASMQYIKDCAMCITNEKEIDQQLTMFLNSKDIQKKIALSALEKFEDNHNKEKVSLQMTKSILQLFESQNINEREIHKNE